MVALLLTRLSRGNEWHNWVLTACARLTPPPHSQEAFFKDFVALAGRHATTFQGYTALLKEMWKDQLPPVTYGSFDAAKLWDYAASTTGSLAQRVAWWLCVHAAEHLDLTKIDELRFGVRLCCVLCCYHTLSVTRAR